VCSDSDKTWQTELERVKYRLQSCRVQKGKELNDFQRNLLDIEILSNLRFGSLEIRDTSVTRVTNNYSRGMSSAEGKRTERFLEKFSTACIQRF